MIRDQGLRTVLAADAVCFEETLDRGSLELSMRVRVAVQSIYVLIRERRFLNPWRYGRFAWQLWSHKALRYSSPLLWLAVILANMSLASQRFYLAILVAQGALIVAGIVGFLSRVRRANLRGFAQPYYLLLTNIASLIAVLRYLEGERMVTWRPIR